MFIFEFKTETSTPSTFPVNVIFPTISIDLLISKVELASSQRILAFAPLIKIPAPFAAAEDVVPVAISINLSSIYYISF